MSVTANPTTPRLISSVNPSESARLVQAEWEEYLSTPRRTYRGDDDDFESEEEAKRFVYDILWQEFLESRIPFDAGPQHWEDDYEELCGDGSDG
jgi:hypothetical protein